MPSDLLAKTTADLPGETPGLDAQVLLAHILGQSRSWVLAHPEAELSAAGKAELEIAVRKLQDGIPLPYVLGHWEFFGLDFELTPDVLIPRPETELLVETALAWIRSHPIGQALSQTEYRLLDIGTGSGCIAIALAIHVPRARITATDISPGALAVARRNADRHGVEERISFLECDLLPQPMPETDIIAANLPYIPSAELKDLAVYGREPTLALDGGADGLDFIRRLLDELSDRTRPGCLVLLEIEAGQGRMARAIAEAGFPAANVEIRKDLAGHDRLMVIET